jgi:hypothetical protein
MYHNWYEIYVIGRQAQKDLLRQAEEARRADFTRRSRREEKRQARARRARRPAPEGGPDGLQDASAA